MATTARIGALLAAPAVALGVGVATTPSANAATSRVAGSCSSIYSDGGTITASCSRGTTVTWHCNLSAPGSVGRYYFSYSSSAFWKTGCHAGTAWVRVG